MRFFLVVSYLFLCFTAVSQVLDPQYNPVILQPNRFNNPIVQPDGKILLFGQGAQYVGNTSNTRLVVRLNSDGSFDESFTAPNKSGATIVQDCAILSDGKIMILQSDRPYLRLLNVDGSEVTTFPSGALSSQTAGPNQFVARMISLGGDKIMLIGGSLFTQYNGNQIPNRLVLINGDGSLDVNFNPAINYQNIGAVARQTDGKIVIGLKKDSVNEFEVKRFNTDGTIDNTFISPVMNNQAGKLLILSNGKILVGGIFTTVGGIEKKTLIRLNSNGSLDNSFLFSNGENTSIGLQSIVVAPNNKIIVAGKSYQSLSPYLYRLFEDGSRDQTFVSKANEEVSSLAILDNGKLLISGPFVKYQNEPRFSMALLDNEGNLDQTFNVPVGAVASYFAVNVDANGRMYLYGNMRQVNGTITNSIIRLTADGSLDPSFPEGTGFAGGIDVFSFQSDGKLIVAGTFNQYNGISKNGMIRFNTDDSVDPNFTVNVAGNSGLVYDIYPLSNGKIIIAGDFTSVDGVSRNYLARLNADGTIDESFNVNNILTSYTRIKILQDGSILLFKNTSIAKYSPDLELVSNFKTPVFDSETTIAGITEAEDGKMYVYGYFSLYTSELVTRRIIRLNANGSLDNSFANRIDGASSTKYTVPSSTGSIDGLLVYENKLLIFGDVNLNGRQGLVATSLDGREVLGNFYVEKNGNFRNFFLRGNKLFLVGDFWSINNQPRSGIAALNLTQAIPSAPTNLLVTESRPYAISLAWDDNSATESGYELQVSAGSQTNWKYVASLVANTTTYTYYTPDYYLGQNLYFRVAAVVPAGSSEPSNIVSVVPLPIPPNTLEVSAASSTAFDLTWNNGPSNSSIAIQRKKANQNFSFINVSESAINNYRDLNTEINTPYVYRVSSSVDQTFVNSSTSLATQNGYWNILSEFPGQSRQLAFSFVINNKFYYGGGSFINGLKDFWEYNLLTRTWTRKADFPGTADVGQTVIASKWIPQSNSINTGDLAMVVGGLNSANNPVDEVWYYDTNNDVWIARSPFPGGPLYGASTFNVASTYSNYQISIVCGGVDPQLNTSSTWGYDWERYRWFKKADFPGEARVYGSSMGFPFKAYYGLGSIGGVHANDMWEYDYILDTWTQIENFPGEARSFAASSSLHNKGFIIGGNNDVESFSDVWEFNSNTETWISRTSMPVTLTGSSIATNDVELLILGGSSLLSPNFSNSLYHFDPTIELPEAPSNLTIEYDFPNTAILRWDDTSFENYFVVERSTDNIDYDSIAFIEHNITNYNDNTIEPGITYFYKVRSVNRAGSNNSEIVNFLVTAIDERSNELNVFPNPTIGKLHIQYATYIQNIAVVDMKGHTVFDLPVESSSEQIIDLTHLAEGLYILQLKTESGKKLIKVARKNSL